ncbi:MAG: DNA recombination protein RmuC, partial [Verrucomicrobiota bacterium]
MPVGIQLIISAVIGGALGILFGWLKWGGKGSDARLESVLQEQMKQRETELEKLRGQISEAGNARAAAEAKLNSTEKMLVEQRVLQDKTLIDLREAFKALSADALKQTAPEFLRLAEQSFGKFQETAKGDLAQRHEAIKTLVEPLKQQLETYQKRLQQSEATQTSTLGEVKKQLEM